MAVVQGPSGEAWGDAQDVQPIQSWGENILAARLES